MSRPRTQLEQAAEWAVAFRLDDAPADVLELATWQIANLLAAIHAGANTAAGRRVWRAHRRTMTAGPCTIVPHGVGASLWDALYLNAVYANALELDDYIYRGHLSPATVLVPLALGELLRLDGRSSLRAQIIGNELAGRLGSAISAEIRHGHQRSYLLRFAAAAGAGALLGLDQQRMTMAMAIALTQPEVPLHRGEFSPDTKILSAASSVVEGTRAAYLADEGLGAAADILEHPAGFYRQFTMQREVATPFVQLGEAWCTHALSFKRYAACAYAAGAVDAACEIHRDPAFDGGAIEGFEIATSLPAITLERLAEPHEPGVLTPVNVQFSIRRSVAAALALGDIRGRDYAEPAAARVYAAVHRLEPRASVIHDWRYTIHALRGLDGGLREQGTRRSADMLQFYRTMQEFRRMFGSTRAIGLEDIGRLLELPDEERAFFTNRWKRSLLSHLGGARHDGAPAPFGDLRRMSARMAARVTVTFTGGRTVSRERIIPTGFAGDPDRGRVVHDKLHVETAGTLDHDACERLWQAVIDLPRGSDATRVVALACGADAGQAGAA